MREVNEAKGLNGVLQSGDLVDGKYRVDQEIASGAMGLIFAATRVVGGARVAVKVLRANAAATSLGLERFRQEARAMAKLKSRHVCRASDAGLLSSGAAYIVMELLTGHDLAAELRQRKRLTTAEAATYLLQACEAVAEAHSHGIVHRDLKPSNLFLARTENGYEIKVLDFGVSKVPRGEHGELELTLSEQILGSPLYMSPEQIRNSKQVDARSDVWSLGVVLHELVTGVPPFSADTVGAVLAKIAADSPPPLRSLVPDADVKLEQLILRCLERAPNQRFPSVAAFARALAPFAPNCVVLIGQTRGPLTPESPSDTLLAHTAQSGLSQLGADPGRRRYLVLLPIGLGLVLAFGVSRIYPRQVSVPEKKPLLRARANGASERRTGVESDQSAAANAVQLGQLLPDSPAPGGVASADPLPTTPRRFTRDVAPLLSTSARQRQPTPKPEETSERRTHDVGPPPDDTPLVSHQKTRTVDSPELRDR